MYSKLFPAEEQLWDIQDEKGFRSRILSYSPELLLMEWHFFNAGHEIQRHSHYHAQLSYVVSGAFRLILDDGTECLCKAGDSVSFAPNEAHTVITAEPDTVILDAFSPIRLDHLERHKKLDA